MSDDDLFNAIGHLRYEGLGRLNGQIVESEAQLHSVRRGLPKVFE